jgi:hypothetical protein
MVEPSGRCLVRRLLSEGSPWQERQLLSSLNICKALGSGETSGPVDGIALAVPSAATAAAVVVLVPAVGCPSVVTLA